MSFGFEGNQFEQFLVSRETAREAWHFVVLPPVRIESGKLWLVFTACPTDNHFYVVGLTCASSDYCHFRLDQDVFGPIAGHGSRGSLDERVNGFPCEAEGSLTFNVEVVELFHVSFLGGLYRTFHPLWAGARTS